MTDPKPVEVIFYIHGVSPAKRPGDHKSLYKDMHDGVTQYVDDRSFWPSEYSGAEWGWNYDGGLATGHKELANAQRRFGAEIKDCLTKNSEFGINMAFKALGLRDVIFHGFGDMFYYISQEGKWSVRHAVASQLAEHIYKRTDTNGVLNHPVSLTILGHSAGAVIGFDIMYYLFNSKRSDEWFQPGRLPPHWTKEEEKQAYD